MKPRSLRAPCETLTIVVAHPDDEIVFFLGWIRALRPAGLRLVCATGDFGSATRTRRAEFAAAAAALGGQPVLLGLADRDDPLGAPGGTPLDRERLGAALASVEHVAGDPVLTHGPMGEYGHCHHVDVFRAVCERFGEDVWCLAGPLESHEARDFGRDGIEEKRRLLETLYPSQRGIGSWVCGYEALCHVGSSRFAPLFDPSTPAAAGLGREFLDCLEARYLGAQRRLPRPARVIRAAWNSARFDTLLAARFADWQEWLASRAAR